MDKYLGCSATKHERLRGFMLNDYEHYKSIVKVIHECQLPLGHTEMHECGCEFRFISATKVRSAKHE